MRSTVEFDADTAKAIQQLCAELGLGLSESANELIRRGLTAPRPVTAFVPVTRPLGLHADVSNVAEVLDPLEGATHR